MNSVIILGNTTNSMELKQTQNGKMVTSFSLAVKRPYSDNTDFFNCTAWDKTAETLVKYVGKGDKICVRGYLQTRSWEDQQGNKRTVVEVVAQEFTFCGSKASSEGKDTTPTNKTPQRENSLPPAKFEDADIDADLPF